jgi:NADPH-dependent glutamate synthase beta subunit-like oxidoreductase
MLLRPIHELQDTDIAQHAFEVLKNTNIQRVHLLGRRGPAQASFTTKELRELTTLSNCKTFVLRSDLTLGDASEAEIKKERGKKRLVELLQKAQVVEDFSQTTDQITDKAAFIHFFCNPSSFIGQSHVKGVKVERTKLEGPPEQQKAIGTGHFSEITCDLVFRSVGYKSVPLEDVPFDKKLGIIPNTGGRVISNNGLYVCGWVL